MLPCSSTKRHAALRLADNKQEEQPHAAAAFSRLSKQCLGVAHCALGQLTELRVSWTIARLLGVRTQPYCGIRLPRLWAIPPNLTAGRVKCEVRLFHHPVIFSYIIFSELEKSCNFLSVQDLMQAGCFYAYLGHSSLKWRISLKELSSIVLFKCKFPHPHLLPSPTYFRFQIALLGLYIAYKRPACDCWSTFCYFKLCVVQALELS